MTALEIAKNRIESQYRTAPETYARIRMTHPKVELDRDRVTILGVYKNIFMIEEYTTGVPKKHTLQYTDVLTGQFSLVE